MNVAVVEPADTTTAPCTFSAAELLDRVTVPPLDFDNVTVQVLVPPVPSMAGVHDRALTAPALARPTVEVAKKHP